MLVCFGQSIKHDNIVCHLLQLLLCLVINIPLFIWMTRILLLWVTIHLLLTTSHQLTPSNSKDASQPSGSRYSYVLVRMLAINDTHPIVIDYHYFRSARDN